MANGAPGSEGWAQRGFLRCDAVMAHALCMKKEGGMNDVDIVNRNEL